MHLSSSPRRLPAFRIALGLLALAALCAPDPAPADSRLILFDQGHGQAFTIEGDGTLDLSRLAEVMREGGGDVRSLGGRIDGAALRGAAGLVISGPFQPYDRTEIDAVRDYLAAGGRVAVMLHVPFPVTGLLESLGVVHSRAVVHEADQLIGDSGIDFTVTRLEPHPLTDGIGGFAVRGGWGVKNLGRSAVVIARTGPRAWFDTNGSGAWDAPEPVESTGVVVAGTLGKGAFLVFGDDAIFQNQFLTGDNAALARNLAGWFRQ